MEENKFSYLLEDAERQYKLSAYNYAASGFSQIAGSVINYGALTQDAEQLKTQASSIELQAKEQANRIREQFIEAAGAYQMNAAQRGISISSMSVRDNLEQSAMNMNEDIAKMDRSAALKASALRSQAKIAGIRGKYGMISGVLGGASNLALAGASYKSGGK